MSGAGILEDQVQKLLSVVYQVPIGLVESDKEGNIAQANAKGLQLLMPLFSSYRLLGDNINVLLQIVTPELLNSVYVYPGVSGIIADQQRTEITFTNNIGEITTLQYKFSVNKLNTNSFLYFFEDITTAHNKQVKLGELQLENAVAQTKFEIASDVLHDIGNAVVGFGSYVTKIKRSAESNDVGTLENIKGFIEKNLPSLSTAIGDKKANALVDLFMGLITSQKNWITEIKTSVNDQLKIISHIHEILNIQRQYVQGQSGERLPVNICSIMDDTVSMLFGAMEKRGIIYHFDAPVNLPVIKGDRTKLIQVFLNLLKNSIESMTGFGHTNTEKEIYSSVSVNDQMITVQIRDTGNGFDAETAAKLFERGYTTKTEGTGLGLANCRSIIDGHRGELTLVSDGIGKGATASVVFNL